MASAFLFYHNRCTSYQYGDLRDFNNNQTDIQSEAVDTLKSIVTSAKRGFSEGKMTQSEFF